MSSVIEYVPEVSTRRPPHHELGAKLPCAYPCPRSKAGARAAIVYDALVSAGPGDIRMNEAKIYPGPVTVTVCEVNTVPVFPKPAELAYTPVPARPEVAIW